MSDRITVLLFAAAREVVGASELQLPTTQITDAKSVLDALCALHPGLKAYRRSLRVAINGEYARDDSRVSPGDEVAIIPPVAGG